MEQFGGAAFAEYLPMGFLQVRLDVLPVHRNPDITITGGGTMQTVLATAQHKDSGSAFTINANGDIAPQ